MSYYLIGMDSTDVLGTFVRTPITSNASGDIITTGAISGGSLTLSSPLGVASGGTGIASYAVGDILYASGATTLSKLADVATGNALISGGVATAPSWGKIGLTTHVSGTLGVGNGGTGTATTFTAGSVVFAGASGVYAQDNSHLFWDDANDCLGIGTASPDSSYDLHVQGSDGAVAGIKLQAFRNSVAGARPQVDLYSADGTSASPSSIPTGGWGAFRVFGYTGAGYTQLAHFGPAVNAGASFYTRMNFAHYDGSQLQDRLSIGNAVDVWKNGLTAPDPDFTLGDTAGNLRVSVDSQVLGSMYFGTGSYGGVLTAGSSNKIRLPYDASNYIDITCSSAGIITYNTTGARHDFADNVSVSNQLLVGSNAAPLSGADIEIRKSTGTATLTPLRLTLRSTDSAGDWDTTNPWGIIGYYTDDVTSSGPKYEVQLAATKTGVGGGTSVFSVGNHNGSSMQTNLTVNASGLVTIGSTASSGATATGNGDLLVKDDIEIDGEIDQDGTGTNTFAATTNTFDGTITISSPGELNGAPVLVPFSLAASVAIVPATPNWTKYGEITCSTTKGFTTEKAGSIIGITCQYDVTASVAPGALTVDVYKAGSIVYSKTLSTSTANDKEAHDTQARATDTFTAGQVISVALNLASGTSATVRNIIVSVRVVYD